MKKKYIWLIEIMIWLLILSGCFFFFIYKTTIKNSTQNTYYLFFDDAGGLVRGSPVRLMGINIGYVRNVKIFDNKVFISFLVTKEGTVLPKSAVASIQFYGLGGSTSLELYPSNSSNSDLNEQLIPSESYRVQDFWEGQKLVSNVLVDIYGGIGRTIQSTGILHNKQILKQSKLVEEYLNQSKAVNCSESVIIYKLSESVLPYIEKKQFEENNDNHKKEAGNE